MPDDVASASGRGDWPRLPPLATSPGSPTCTGTRRALMSPPDAGKAEADRLHHCLVPDEWYLPVVAEPSPPVVGHRPA
jgi:hypothetical protein